MWACALGSGDANSVAADMKRLEAHAFGVWVVDDGLAYSARKPPVVGGPAALQVLVA
jgi:hypothetical protein